MDIKKKIAEMLTENTGVAMMDSGGDDGRMWQRNQGKDFEKENEISVDTSFDDVTVSLSTFHYLTSFLEMTDESEALQNDFNEFADLAEHEDTNWFSLMEDFEPEDMVAIGGIVNTYNYENALSQVLQYKVFTLDKYNCPGDPIYSDKIFIMLQIHGGADVRGGYTKPHIFEIDNDGGQYVDFLMSQTDVNCYCEKCEESWYSENSGYGWDNDNGIDLEFKIVNDKACHAECGCELSFSASFDY